MASPDAVQTTIRLPAALDDLVEKALPEAGGLGRLIEASLQYCLPEPDDDFAVRPRPEYALRVRQPKIALKLRRMVQATADARRQFDFPDSSRNAVFEESIARFLFLDARSRFDVLPTGYGDQDSPDCEPLSETRDVESALFRSSERAFRNIAKVMPDANVRATVERAGWLRSRTTPSRLLRRSKRQFYTMYGERGALIVCIHAISTADDLGSLSILN